MEEEDAAGWAPVGACRVGGSSSASGVVRINER